MIFFGGGGALALDDGVCDPLLFQKGGIFPTTNKTLKGHSYHLIFHIKRPTPIHLKPLSATVVALIRFISHQDL